MPSDFYDSCSILFTLSPKGWLVSKVEERGREQQVVWSVLELTY
jgi:hypothetical protein